MVSFELSRHISKLKNQQATKPAGERLAVPTQKELAELVGISETSMSKLAQNRIDSISKSGLGVIIKEFRRLGFDTDIKDLIRYDDED